LALTSGAFVALLLPAPASALFAARVRRRLLHDRGGGDLLLRRGRLLAMLHRRGALLLLPGLLA
jgi:hypothetical protein